MGVLENGFRMGPCGRVCFCFRERHLNTQWGCGTERNLFQLKEKVGMFHFFYFFFHFVVVIFLCSFINENVLFKLELLVNLRFFLMWNHSSLAIHMELLGFSFRHVCGRSVQLNYFGVNYILTASCKFHQISMLFEWKLSRLSNSRVYLNSWELHRLDS